jgi:hypothetical protein
MATIREMHTRSAVFLLVFSAAAAGCSVAADTSPPAAGGGTSGPSSLVRIHNPGHVTYSRHYTKGQCHARGTSPATYAPDPSCTPGGVDPNITQANTGRTICRRGGYTDSVRPPVSQTNAAKRGQYLAYGIRTGTGSELDHLVPLSLGGDNDIANLWPEAGAIPNPKDKVELDLRNAVCGRRVNLAKAQQAIATDWTTAEEHLGL